MATKTHLAESLDIVGDTTIKSLVEDRVKVIPVRSIDDTLLMVSRAPDWWRFVRNRLDKHKGRRNGLLNSLRILSDKVQIEP